MDKRTFDQPVRLQSSTRRWTISNVEEAIHCMRSSAWPRRGPATSTALKAMGAAVTGLLTRAEAREAFEDAALEAHLLDVGTSH